MTKKQFGVGDWVEVREAAEILKTLDRDGRLEGLPFMPEMLAFCGQRFQVYKSAHKTCDTVNPIRGVRMTNAIHLETRCDGKAHGGCEASCLLFWKEAWLKPAPNGAPAAPAGAQDAAAKPASVPATQDQAQGQGCTLQDLQRSTVSAASVTAPAGEIAYACQATQVPAATTLLNPWDFRQYVEDYTSGNVGLGQWLRGFIFITYQNLITLGIGWGPILRWLYDAFQKLWGGLPYPRWEGKIPVGQKTPSATLNLQVGEWVRVKSYKEILETCDASNRNRGMGFDGEMVPFCGRTYRVLKRVTRILNEKTGKMQEMKNPCIILENVFCQGRYSQCRLFCPRSIYPYWREIWLERVNPPVGQAT